MRASIYIALCAALAVTVHSSPVPNEDQQNYMGLESINMDVDPETINYLLPKLAAKYRPSAEWRRVTDPRFYVLTEMESNEIDNQEPNLETNDVESGQQRKKRQSSRIADAGGSLSIVNSLDVLRNRLLLEIARKKAREGANRNRQLLMNLGKRVFTQRAPRRVYFQHNEV